MSKHKFHASGEIPFAWEIKPGMSKVAPGGGREELPKVAAPASRGSTPKLPPPPCPREARLIMPRQVLHIPLPPCPRLSWRASTCPRSAGPTWDDDDDDDDDPFLAAYMECTRGGAAWDPAGRSVAPPPKQQHQQQKKKTTTKNKQKGDGAAGSSREVFGIPSCKTVRDVVEDGVVRLSRLPSAQLSRRRS